MKNLYHQGNLSGVSRMACRVLAVAALMLFCTVGTLKAQCYETSHSSGISMMKQKDYDKAIQWFEQAKNCPDKPSNNDLDAKIKECRNLKAKAAKDKKEADDKRRREAEEARLREEQERIQREYEEEQELQMARSAYMQITGVNFVNVDSDNNPITSADILYWQDIKFMMPVIHYNGLADTERSTILYCKIYKPGVGLITWSDSPSGYSYDYKMTVKPGNGNEQRLTSWGSKDGGTFVQGTYYFEIYNADGGLLDTREFAVFDKPPTTVSVTFIVDDKTADIYVNGSRQGTGRAYYYLEIGKSYDVETRKASHTTPYVRVTGQKGMETTIRLESPKPIYGSLSVTASKSDVDVYLNGDYKGKAPQNFNQLLIGDYNLKLTKKNFYDYTATAKVKANQQSSLHAEMQRVKRTPWLTSVPPRFSSLFFDVMYGFDKSLGAQLAYCHSHIGFFAHYMHGLNNNTSSISGGVVLRLTNDVIDLQLFGGPAYNKLLNDNYNGYYYYSQWMGNMGLRISWRGSFIGLWDLMGGVMTDFDGRLIPYAGIGVGYSVIGGLGLLIGYAATASK